MTVSAASSPVVLSTNAAEPAKAVAPATASASADAGGDGFQQLLAQAAESACAATGVELLPVNGAATPPATTAQSGGEDGNALPLLAELLPLTSNDAITTETGETKAKTKADSDKADKDADDKVAADTGVTLMNALLPPVVLPIAPPVVAAASAAIDTADANSVDNAALSGVDLATPMLKKEEAAAAKNTVAPTAARDNIAAATQLDTTALLNAGSDRAKQQQDASPDSEFDALIKQLDATPSTPTSTSASNGIDSGRTVQQAARPYLATPTATVSVPVAAEGWSDAVADKVMWFSANKINSAEIHLNPPDLGPIQVRISTQQDQATVYFTSQHASVREALDQALPRLREMMNGQGIQLADAGVGGQNSPRQQEYRGNSDGRPRSSADSFFRDIGDSSEPIGVSSVSAARITRSGIDAYV